MQKITSIIIDDEPAAIEILEMHLSEIDYVTVAGTFTKATSALDWLLENHADVIFLDVEMPGKTGFEFLEDLKDYPDIPCIIFVTGFGEYAIEALRNSAFDFLLKPIAMDELEQALQRYKVKCSHENFRQNAQSLFKMKSNPEKIVFTHSRGFNAYEPDEILYIQAERNYSQVYLTTDKSQIVSMQLGQIEKSLPTFHFFRINRSVIINLKYFTHADQKLKQCFLGFNGEEYAFKTRVAKIRELQRVMMGGL